MFHLDNTSGVPEMPEPKEQQSITPKWFGESVEQGGISYPGADWFNIIQAELLNILVAAGVSPDKISHNQIVIALHKMLLSRSNPGGEIASDGKVDVFLRNIGLSDVITTSPVSTYNAISRACTDSDLLVVGTWNIQTYAVIVNKFNRNISNYRRFYELSKFVHNAGCHVIGFQETYDGPGAHMKNLVVSPYVSSYFGKSTLKPETKDLMVGYSFGNTVMSKYDLTENFTFRLADEGGYNRVITRSVFFHNVHGKVAIYCIHGSWFHDSIEKMNGFILSDYKNLGINKVIILGDFNYDASTGLFSAFVNDGFNIVNNMQYDTSNSDAGPWFIDNFLIKGFTVGKVTTLVPDSTLADHKMLTVELRGL